MSRWWIPAASALLEPGRASVAGKTRTERSPGWSGALAALDALLQDLPRRALRLVLSNHFARFLVVPWDRALAGLGERTEFLRHHFAEIYGAQAAQWSFAVDGRSEGDTRLALAVDTALIDEARALAMRRRASLVAVEPLMTAEFNRLRRRFREETLFFAVLEPGRVCSLLVRDGGASRVVNQRSADPAAELELIVALERLEARLPAEVAPLHVVERVHA